MFKLVVSLTLALCTSSAFACQCQGFESLPDNWAVHLQASLLAKRQVSEAEEVLRVRVLNMTDAGNDVTTYTVQVQERLKSRIHDRHRKLITGPSSCSLSMRQGEEWLLFVKARRLSACAGSVPLQSVLEQVPGASASDVARANEWRHQMSLRWLAFVREAVANEHAR